MVLILALLFSFLIVSSEKCLNNSAVNQISERLSSFCKANSSYHVLFAGSSTACIVVLDRTSHRLHTANLGDSGFLVVRGGEVVHRSDEQQHYFNTPFQLSIAPPEAEGVVLSDR